MFKRNANAMFINETFTRENIRGMHETMVRLYEAAKKLKGLETPADVARALNWSEQRVNNWTRRGISKEGMLMAQELFGCSATWLKTGVPPMEVVNPKSGAYQIETKLSDQSEAPTYNPLLGPHHGDLPHPTTEDSVLVPQLDVVAACGEGRFNDHVVVDGGRVFPRAQLREIGVPERAARLIQAAGGSMRPTIQDGRQVLINIEDREPVENKIYAICMPYDGIVLKRLVREYSPAAGGMVWMIKSDNPDKIAFPDKMLPPDDRTMIAGRAVWTDSLL